MFITSQLARRLCSRFDKRLLSTPTISVGMDKIFESILFVGLSVCLSVCLFVCPQNNSRMNDPNEWSIECITHAGHSIVFKLGVGNDLGYPRSDTILGLKGEMSRSQGQ